MRNKVLIVDDDDAIIDSIKVLLEMEGYEVSTIVSGDVLGQIDKNIPNLILLDIWMSGQDGRDICRSLKKNDDTKDIPVIMISAGKNIAKSAQDAGAQDFIAKPFEIEELLTKVKKYIAAK